MTDEQMLDAFTLILSYLIPNGSFRLTLETRREDVAGWDSLAYISFIVGVEQEFGVRFGVAEVESFENVGSIVRRTRELASRR